VEAFVRTVESNKTEPLGENEAHISVRVKPNEQNTHRQVFDSAEY